MYFPFLELRKMAQKIRLDLQTQLCGVAKKQITAAARYRAQS